MNHFSLCSSSLIVRHVKLKSDTKPNLAGACSVQFESKTLIYAYRTVYGVVDCGLELLGSMEIEFIFGSCTVAAGSILLCFSGSSNRACFKSMSSTGPFTETKSSLFTHDNISIASSR